MAPQDRATTDDENGDVIGVIGFFKPTHPKYPGLENNASVSHLNSLKQQRRFCRELRENEARMANVSAPPAGVTSPQGVEHYCPKRTFSGRSPDNSWLRRPGYHPLTSSAFNNTT